MGFKSDLKATKDLDHLFTDKFLDRTPALFGPNRPAWGRWRHELAGRLGVDAHSIVLVGSACVGFSLNPAKKFKPFDSASDVDVAVISYSHFETSWNFMRGVGAGIYNLPDEAKDAIKEHRSRHIFDATIATDKMLAWLPFGRQWFVAASETSASDPVAGRQVNFRIYRDAQALRAYQLKGLGKAQATLLAEGETWTT